MFSLIDTHAHYNSESLDYIYKAIDTANNNYHLSDIINVGLDYDTSKEAVDIANKNSKFYASIGIHPLYEGKVSSLLNLYSIVDNKKIVAVGETGIDTSKSIYKQIDKMIDSIYLANKYRLPVIIHANTTKNSYISANEMCLHVLKIYKPLYGFVFHSIQPNINDLRQIINLGGYISIGPMILKQNANKSLEIVRKVPLDNLLIETDYPYLTSTPSVDRLLIFNYICNLKQESQYNIMNRLNKNAKRLFYKMK